MVIASQLRTVLSHGYGRWNLGVGGRAFVEGRRGTRPLSAKHEHLETLEQICVQSGVVALYAFGSRAKEVSDWLTRSTP